MRQKGFTLIEVLLALAVGSVILTGAVAGIYSILVTTGRSVNQTVSLTDIDRAVLAIKNDLLMTQTTDLVDGVQKSSANLTWIDYTGGNQVTHSSAYALNAGSKELRRTYTTAGNSTISIVGRNVASLSFTQSDKLVTVTISASRVTASQTETLTFRVHLRPEEIQ